uniref:Uncharacterized protein n=1 Tax=Arundo donax TaxID=35708 RepID=A0A0A8XSG6_ARUDO
MASGKELKRDLSNVNVLISPRRRWVPRTPPINVEKTVYHIWISMKYTKSLGAQSTITAPMLLFP